MKCQHILLVILIPLMIDCQIPTQMELYNPNFCGHHPIFCSFDPLGYDGENSRHVDCKTLSKA